MVLLGIVDLWEAQMLKFLFGAITGIALLVGAVVVAADPVPYSWDCFNPTRYARAACHRQVEVTQWQMRLEELPSMSPSHLLEQRDQIVAQAERMRARGFSPMDIGAEPQQLRQLIDALLNPHGLESL
jgi:hypothetical protein